MKIWDIKMIVVDLAFAVAHDASEKGWLVRIIQVQTSEHQSSNYYIPSM